MRRHGRGLARGRTDRGTRWLLLRPDLAGRLRPGREKRRSARRLAVQVQRNLAQLLGAGPQQLKADAAVSGLIESFARTSEIQELGAWLGADAASRPPLERALARALGDDSVQLAYWVPARHAYADANGRPAQLPDAGTWTPTPHASGASTRLEDLPVSVAALLVAEASNVGLAHVRNAGCPLVPVSAAVGADHGQLFRFQGCGTATCSTGANPNGRFRTRLWPDLR
jgi:hypothetical protein